MLKHETQCCFLVECMLRICVSLWSHALERYRGKLLSHLLFFIPDSDCSFRAGGWGFTFVPNKKTSLLSANLVQLCLRSWWAVRGQGTGCCGDIHAYNNTSWSCSAGMSWEIIWNGMRYSVSCLLRGTPCSLFPFLPAARQKLSKVSH